MYTTIFPALILFLITFSANAQSKLLDVEQRTLKTITDVTIEAEIGFMEVPENRNKPNSRKIKVKYAHLKSLGENPGVPLVYLEGGGGGSTWQVDSPQDLTDWIEVLEVSDIIFFDRRGSDDKSLTYVWEGEYPRDFFESETSAYAHYKKMTKAALSEFEKRDVDVRGYTIEEQARDVSDLMSNLEINKYSIFGFSFGSQIGMTLMRLFPEEIESAVFAGADAPYQSFNFPRYLDICVDKFSEKVDSEKTFNEVLPDFKELVHRVIKKLEENPVLVRIKNPVTRKKTDLKVGAFGLALLLRLDIDDSNDIPIIPRLLYKIDKGDYELLTWFIQKRAIFGIALSGNGINQQLASGADEERWKTILEQADKSIFGNVMNFPFSAAKDNWMENDLSFDASIPVKTDIPTLFITGELDCRTPIEQVERIRTSFMDATHIIVDNAGHEQAMWERQTFNEIIPAFLKGDSIKIRRTKYSKIKFIPVTGKSKKHPALR